MPRNSPACAAKRQFTFIKSVTFIGKCTCPVGWQAWS